MTGMQFADILHDAAMLSGWAPPYAWARVWKTERGVPLGIAAEEAASEAGREGLLQLWLHACAQAFRGRYTVGATDFARAMDAAAHALRARGAILFPTAAHDARAERSFAAWSAAAYAGGLRTRETACADEGVFLPWLCAMCARYEHPDPDVTGHHRRKPWN